VKVWVSNFVWGDHGRDESQKRIIWKKKKKDYIEDQKKLLNKEGKEKRRGELVRQFT